MREDTCYLVEKCFYCGAARSVCTALFFWNYIATYEIDFLKSPSLVISGSGGGFSRFRKKTLLSSTCGQVYLWEYLKVTKRSSMQLFSFDFRKPRNNLPVRNAYSKIALNTVLTIWSTVTPACSFVSWKCEFACALQNTFCSFWFSCTSRL